MRWGPCKRHPQRIRLPRCAARIGINPRPSPCHMYRLRVLQVPAYTTTTLRTTEAPRTRRRGVYAALPASRAMSVPPHRGDSSRSCCTRSAWGMRGRRTEPLYLFFIRFLSLFFSRSVFILWFFRPLLHLIYAVRLFRSFHPSIAGISSFL